MRRGLAARNGGNQTRRSTSVAVVVIGCVAATLISWVSLTSAAPARPPSRATLAYRMELNSGAGKALRRRPRASALKLVGAALRAEARGRRCTALVDMDLTRLIVEDRSSYARRGKGAVRAMSHLSGRLNHAELAIVAAKRLGSCVKVGRRARPVAPGHISGTPVPAEHGFEAEHGGRPPHQRLPKGARLSHQHGNPVTFASVPSFPTATTASGSVVQVYRRTNLGHPNPSYPEENQAASGHGVVVYTGNDDAFYSVDGGATFTHMDPATVFGAGPSNFCCDQVVRYSPAVNRFFWLLQGNCGTQDCRGTHTIDNRYRLAVASPEQISAAAHAGRSVEAVWTPYDLTQSLFGDHGVFYDFPDLGVGDQALYLTWDHLGGGGGSIFARMNLRQLAAGGDASVFYWKLPGTGGGPRIAQSSGNTGYLVANSDNSDATQASVRYTRADSPLLFHSSLPHLAVPNRDYCSDTGFSARGFACSATPGCPPTGGTPGMTGDDWANRKGCSGDEVGGATVGGPHHDQLWLAWTAGRGYVGRSGNTWKQPHIQYVGYRLPSFAKFFEGTVYRPDVAIEFPFLNADQRGDVAMSFAYGGPTVSPRPAAGILVPASSSDTASFFDVGVGDAINPFNIPASAGFVDRSQGDYTTIQPDGDNPNLFVTGGPIVKYVGTGSNRIPQDQWVFARFGYGHPLAGPTVTITSPPSGSTFPSDQTITVHGVATDWSGRAITAPSQLQWLEDGVAVGNGGTLSLAAQSVGFHTITLQAIDDAGRMSSASIRIQVTPAGSAHSPSVAIDQPTNGQNYPSGDTTPITFTAHGTEGSGGPLTASDVSWTDTYTDSHGITQHRDLGSGLSLSQTLYYNGTSPTTHTITVTATDPVSHLTAQDTVQITVGVFT